MLKRFKNWLIKLLGGYTANEYKAMKILCERRDKEIEGFDAQKKAFEDFGWLKGYIAHKNEVGEVLNSLKTCEAEIPLGGAMRYNADNVITESRQQTYYLLGKAVYPYAKHFITETKYICAVNVQKDETEGKT